MITEFTSQLHYVLKTVIVSVLFFLAFLYLKENKNQIKRKVKSFLIENKTVVAFLFYSALLLTNTVIGRPYTYPFVDVIGIIGLWRNGHFFVGNLINIIIFIPYTYLYILSFKPSRRIISCVCLTLVTTMFIEVCQLIFWVGQFSFADMIHNTIGGIIGWGGSCIYRFFQKPTRKAN